MLLLFAHHYDNEAKWLAQSLQKENEGIKVKIVVAEALGIDYDICLSIKTAGSNGTILFKEDKGHAVYKNVALVINRLVYINPIIWNKSDDKEKLYATSEINAFFAAFIHSFDCMVVNPVEHGSLAGSWFIKNNNGG